jgi:hypothetical protein
MKSNGPGKVRCFTSYPPFGVRPGGGFAGLERFRAPGAYLLPQGTASPGARAHGLIPLLPHGGHAPCFGW